VDFVDVAHTPLAPHAAPARIAVRSIGAGAAPPLVILHGGWEYEAYPFDRQIPAFSTTRRLVIPDRSGYGDSPAIDALPPDFHDRACAETLAVLDALALERPVVWGHSDGAIIALLLGLESPDTIAAAIVEATHLYRRKPR